MRGAGEAWWRWEKAARSGRRLDSAWEERGKMKKKENGREGREMEEGRTRRRIRGSERAIGSPEVSGCPAPPPGDKKREGEK